MGDARNFKSHPNLGTLLRNARMAHGLSLAEVASRIGTTKSYLCEVERGISPSPSFVMVALLSDALRIPMKHLKDAALTVDTPKPERNMEIDRHEDDTDSWW